MSEMSEMSVCPPPRIKCNYFSSGRMSVAKFLGVSTLFKSTFGMGEQGLDPDPEKGGYVYGTSISSRGFVLAGSCQTFLERGGRS